MTRDLRNSDNGNNNVNNTLLFSKIIREGVVMGLRFVGCDT